MGVTAIDEARALVADETLWPLVRDFLWDFAPQVHRSWLDGVPGISGISGICGNPRVKAHVLSSLGVRPCFHAFPKGDWSRLLLLDGETLESVSKWLGALACADGLRRVTDGKVVRELKASLHGVYPDVFGFTAYFKRDLVGLGDAGDDGAGALDRVVSQGLSMLNSLVAPLPESLSSRLRFKLLKREWPEGRETLDTVRERLETALARLLKLKFPEAYTLCC